MSLARHERDRTHDLQHYLRSHQSLHHIITFTKEVTESG
jgi:hypothetical protein